MTTFSPIDDFSQFGGVPQAQSRSDLGQEDFLTLMITQFKNQDPFEPMDNGEFLGQLAQFSTVSGIDSLNTSFAGLSGALQDEQALQAANLVGRSVMAITDIGHLEQSGSLNGAVELYSSASNVQVDITDEYGQLVQRLNLGQQTAGMVNFSWDGIDSSGDEAPTGHYQVTARVIRGAEVESTPTLIEADIQSVTLGRFGAGMTLNLNGGSALSLAQVYQIT
jgi:flagellar basal-body rod modification protein FlgD